MGLFINFSKCDLIFTMGFWELARHFQPRPYMTSQVSGQG